MLLFCVPTFFFFNVFVLFWLHEALIKSTRWKNVLISCASRMKPAEMWRFYSMNLVRLWVGGWQTLVMDLAKEILLLYVGSSMGGWVYSILHKIVSRVG